MDKIWDGKLMLYTQKDGAGSLRVPCRVITRPSPDAITGMEEPLVGIIELLATIDERTVTDFKTSASSYAEHEVQLSDQLTAYQLAEPEAERMALWVLVKTKEPKIEWHVSVRNPDDLDYLAKAGYVAREIKAGRFFKRPGLCCTWCDFLPVCLKDRRRTEEALVRLA